MRNITKMFLVASLLAAGAVAAPSLYAHEHSGSSGSKAGEGMMGRGGMMGDGGMMGMMNMMSQMSKMMDQCASMMQDANRPNEQGRKPAEPDKGN